MKKRYGIIAIMLLALCIMCVGCTGDKNSGSTSEDKNGVDTKLAGGTLRIATNKYETLNPLLNKDKDVDQVLSLIYEPLMKIGADLKPELCLAKSTTVDNVGASIDIVLRDDVKFHDGNNITADDVVYSLDVLKKASDDVIYKNAMSNIGTYKKIDNTTVRLYLRQVYSNPQYALCFPIIEKAYYTASGNDVTNSGMGTGMFKIESVSQMQELILARNEGYYGTKPYIDKVSVMLVPNEKTTLTAFKQKQIDVMFTEDMIAGQYTGNTTVKMMKYSTMNHDFIGFNFKNELLANSEIRKIIAHSINKQAIIKDVYYGYALAADTMIHPMSFLHTDGTTSYEYDLKMAKNLLAKQKLDEKKLTFNLLVNEENTERIKIAEIVKENLLEVGITINIVKVPFTEYKLKIDNKDFDMLLGGWHLLTNQDISFAFSSASIYSGQNFISYKSDEMDAKLKTAYTQIGEVNVKSSFNSLQEFLGEELPYISICFRENVGYLNLTNVGGTLKPLEHNYYNGIEDLYIIKQ